MPQVKDETVIRDEFGTGDTVYIVDGRRMTEAEYKQLIERKDNGQQTKAESLKPKAERQKVKEV